MDVSLALGSSFLSAFLQVLFDRMASAEFLALFGERKHDFQLLQKLKIALMSIDVVLDDAENKQSKSGAVEKWLNELKNVVYQADDLLDEINTEALKVKVESEYLSVSDQVNNSISSLSNKILKEIMPKISVMTDTLEHFAKQIVLLGLEKRVSRMNNLFRLSSSSLVDETCINGRDHEKEKIIELLCSDDENGNSIISVIPIVGMGGVGKTTFAQLVYNDERVKNHFDVKAWVCVSDEYDVVRVTKTLLSELASLSFDGGDNFNLLQVKLRDNLLGKRFLIVLDDIWNINYNDWDILRNPFRQARKGSKIILTTRDERVALMMRSSPYYLEPISDEDGWTLFLKHAYGNGSLQINPKLEAVGKEIVRKCKGLPLAVKTMGGLLRSKSKVEEWEDALRSSIWELPNDQSGILPALKLSYNHLPSPLKRCFTFCAVFPKGYMISKEDVIRLWLANDLLLHPRKSMEEIGKEYIQELTLRSLFQQTLDGYFTMHDLINDLAQFVSGEFSVRLETQHSHINSVKLRHLSYSRGAIDTIEQFKFLSDAKFLRSFLPISAMPWSVSYLPKELLFEILPTLGSLRLLSLSYYDIVELPHSIGTLSHLRLLDFSFTNIKHLPDSLSSLYNLRVLLLAGCRFLVILPANLGKLVNLRCLEISGTQLTEMPRHMSRLRNLQVLTYFIVGKESGSRVEELGELHDLSGMLSILMLQNIATAFDASKAKLKVKKHIETLSLEWSCNIHGIRNDVDILDNLQPHRNIRNLTIRGYNGMKFANWVGEQSFNNMVSLHLADCKNCVSLPALGQLASLETLTISHMNRISIVGPEFYGSAVKPFQSLKELGLKDMPEWEEWFTAGNGEFSSLLKLWIVDCPKFIGKLPNQLFSLRTLQISGCPNFVLADSSMNPCNGQSIMPQNLSSVRKLIVSGLSNMKELPTELCRLTCLKELKIQGCSKLASFSCTALPTTLARLSIQQCDALLSLPEGMTHITEVIVSDCKSLDSFPISGRVKEISISNCRKLKFPTQNCRIAFESLEHLRIKGSCDHLHDISLGIFPSLQALRIYGCENLKAVTMPDEVLVLASLSSLEICDCTNLVSFAGNGLPAPSLTKLTLCFCSKLTSLPKQMHTLLPSLQHLEVDGCPEIVSFPDEGLPPSLKSLGISNCEKLLSCQSEWNLQRLPCLREFEIGGTNQELFPDETLLPFTLKKLTINDDTTLRRLNHRGLQHLVSLETLYIWHCPRLESLSGAGLNRITSLTSLYIRGCPQIKSLPQEMLPPYLSELQIEECPLLKSYLWRERFNIVNCHVVCDDEVIR